MGRGRRLRLGLARGQVGHETRDDEPRRPEALEGRIAVAERDLPRASRVAGDRRENLDPDARFRGVEGHEHPRSGLDRGVRVEHAPARPCGRRAGVDQRPRKPRIARRAGRRRDVNDDGRRHVPSPRAQARRGSRVATLAPGPRRGSTLSADGRCGLLTRPSRPPIAAKQWAPLRRRRPSARSPSRAIARTWPLSC